MNDKKEALRQEGGGGGKPNPILKEKNKKHGMLWVYVALAAVATIAAVIILYNL